MLPKENRLTKREEFENVTKNGKLFQSPFFGLIFISKKRAPSRFGIVVSNKISKRATARNRAKRLLRQAIRKNMIEVLPGFDVVFLAKKKILEALPQEIEKQTRELLGRAEILK